MTMAAAIITERHPAVVTSTDDPEKRGRVRVACAALMGDEETELPMWVEPVLDWGWFYVPDVGEQIEIEVTTSAPEDERPGQASIDGLNMNWNGARYYGNSDSDNPTNIHEDFKKNYGKRRGFATPGGHILLFDDTDKSRRVTLTWADGAGKFSYFGFDEDGSLIGGTHRAHLLYLNAKDDEVLLVDPSGNTIASEPGGIRVVSASGNMIDITEGATQITNAGAVKIMCKTAQIEAGKVEVAGDTEQCVLGTSFAALFSKHTHPTGMGPSGPPVEAAEMTTCLSTKVTVG